MTAVTDDGDPIEELTAKIERFQTGAEVDFSTDRDDEVGDLYAAVEDLAESVRESDGDGTAATVPREEFERQRSLLDSIFEQVPINLYVKDREGRHVRTSTPHLREEYEGVDEEWFVGKTDRDIYPSDIAAETYADDMAVIESGEPILDKLEYNAEDDEWIRTSKVPWRDDDGEILGLIGISRYVTAERTQKRRLEAIVENTTSRIYVKDRDGVYQFANRAAAESFGLDPEDVVGKTDEDLFDADAVEEIRAGDRRVLEDGEQVTRETVTTVGGEERVFLDDKFPYRDERGEVVGVLGVSRDITERKERERELRETKRRLELALAGTNTGIWEWDPATGEVVWSEALEEILGMVPGEFEGTLDAFRERVHPDDRDRVEDAIEAAVERDESYRVEFRMRHEDGGWRWIESRGRLVEDGDGERMVGIRQDVTEHRERERQLEAIVENTENPIYIKDLDGRYQFMNEAGADYFGLERAETIGKTDEDLFDAETAARIRESDAAVVETGESLTEELPHVIDGEEHVFVVDRHPYRDEAGDVVGVMGVARDVTERKERERELVETNERLNGIIEASPDAIVVMDLDGTVELWNPAAERIFGWSAEEVLGDPPPYVPEELTDQFDRFRERLADGESIAGVETERLREDGARIDVDLSAAPLRDENGGVVGIVGVLEDITERKEYEAELERTRHLMEQSHRLTRVGAWEFRVEDGEPSDIFWTDEVYRIHGLPVDADVSLGEAIEYYHPDDEERIEDAVGRAIREAEPYDEEARLITAEGDERWVRAIGDPVVEDGEVVAVRGSIQDVTERKEREAELERTSNLLEQAGRLASVGGWEVDYRTDPPTTEWTDELYRIHDLPVGAEVTPDETIELFHPEDRDRMRELNERLAETGESYDVELRLDATDADGEQRWVRAIGEAVRGDGEVVKLRGTVQEITERKGRERELRETKRHLELALEGTNTGVWEWDPDTGELDWNDAQAALVGLEPGEFEGTFEAFRRRTHPDDLPRVEAALERAIERDEIYQAEFRMRHEDGDWVWVGGRGRPVEDEDGRRMVGINNDITERKERERELAEYREFTEDVLDAIDDVFYLVDGEGDLQRWNESLAEATGYSDDEIAEMDVRDFFDEADGARVEAALADIENRVGEPLEADVRTRDGEAVPYEFVATPLRDPDGNRVVAGIGRDISERKRHEQRLETRSAAIEAASDGIAILDGDAEYVFANQAHADVYGYDDPSAFVGESWRFCYGDEEVERMEAEVVPALEETGEWRGEAVGRRKDGSTFPQEVTLTRLDDGGYICVVRDISERKERERELERTRDLLQQAGRIARIGGWELDLQADPPSMEWTDELYRLHDLPPETEIDVETAVEFYHPDDRERIRELFDRAVATGEGYDMEVRLQASATETRWMRAIGEPVREDGEVVAVRGSIQDITDRKERELALESLHETTRGLLGTETDAEVAGLVVEAASEVLDTDGVGVYLLDEASNRLEPAAVTDEFAALCGDAAIGAGDGDSLLWDAFVSGAPRAVADPESADGPLFGPDCRSGLLVPVGDHGVFAVASGSAGVDDETRRLAETLVATTEAAMDRLESEASLRERDAELEAQNERLTRQIQITEIIRRIDRSLIQAGNRAEIEDAVCDGLVDADDVAFAWIGSLDAAGDRVEPRAWAGTGGEYLDAVSLATGDPTPEPAAATAASDESTVVGNVVEGLKREPWRKDALAADFHSVLSVPLTYEGYVYGVLAVYATEPGAFGDLERDVFEELGTSIANSINAVETRRALHADTLVELRLALDSDDTFLGRIARDADCEVGYEGLATHADEESRLFFTASAAPGDVEAVLDGLVSVAGYRRVSEGDDGTLFEVTVTGETLPSRLVRHGATPRSIDATPGETTVVVDVPPTVDVREFVEMLREAFPSVELVARRSVERTTQTRQELTASLFGALTDRQLEVLRTAYYAGFFEWPRESTGEDIAAMLDVTQPTVNRHLRIAQQRLLDQLFEETPTVAASD